MDRRTFLTLTGAGLAAAWSRAASVALPGGKSSDDDFLDELQRRCFSYFLERTDGGTGLTLDRGCIDGSPYTLDDRPTGSVTVTGFGLAAFCLASERGWISRGDAAERVRTTLRFFAWRAPQERGWFYHWMHVRAGTRAAAFSQRGELSEVSTIDTALLLAGVLTARQCFWDDREIGELADAIYRRVDFRWMLEPRSLNLRHGWTPESGFIPYRWDEYSEASVLYLLAIGAPANAIPAAAWYSWKRNPNQYGDYRYVGVVPPFAYQYSHAFVDFRGRRERTGVDWFQNSVTATRAHRQFCVDLGPRYPGYTSDIWGVTPSRSVYGYTDWGGPPMDPRIDGTVVPAAPGGALMLAPDICLPALRALTARYGERIFCRYGFTDSFNPRTGWVSPDVTGLNLGIILLSAENLRSGNLWRWFMANPEPRRALDLAGLPAKAGAP